VPGCGKVESVSETGERSVSAVETESSPTFTGIAEVSDGLVVYRSNLLVNETSAKQREGADIRLPE
jgi:hypothetical protein